MTLTLAFNHLAVVATDQRWNFTYTDGRIERRDDGGKLVRLPNGWLTGSGDGNLMQAAFSAVGTSTSAAGVHGAVRAARKVAPVLPGYDPEQTRFLAAFRGRPSIAHLIGSGGEDLGSGSGAYWLTWPPELTTEEVALGVRNLESSLHAAKSATDVVRAAAAAFAFASERADSMSPTVEVGLAAPAGPMQHLVGVARELAVTSDEDMRAHLEAASAPKLVTCNLGQVNAGTLNNLATDPTAGIRLDTSYTIPATWTSYIDFAASGTDPLMVFPGLTILANGDATFSGDLSAAGGTFAGDITAPDCDFAGTITLSSTTPIVSAPNGDLEISTPNDLIIGSTGGGYMQLNGAQHGFFGQTPVSRPTVTGSRGGNAALASLLTALANMGLIVNSTTA